MNIMDKNINSTTKVQLSLAALMFFSPLVSNMLKKDNLELNNEDNKFIKWYIRLGNYLLIILWVTIISWILNYNIQSDIINVIYSLSIISLTTMLVVWTISILTDTNILSWDKKLVDLYYENVTSDKKEVLTNYTPIYNIYLWYTQHNFNQPNLLIKESILAWLIFIILWFFTNTFWASTFLIIIIIRIASLMWWIDFVSPQIKKIINRLFTKNPEEIRWYIKGSIMYLYNKVTDQLNKKEIGYFIDKEKEEFGLLYKIQLHNSIKIKIQYIMFIITFGYLIQQAIVDLNQRIVVIPWLIFIWRYLVMLIKREHLPSLPIYKEITDLLIYIYGKIRPHYHEIKDHFNQQK